MRDGLYYYAPLEIRDKKGRPKRFLFDMAVYGGTPTGVAAAVQAARMGKSVVILSFNGFVGGLTSGGLTATDLGKQNSIGGLALEFYSRIGVIKDFRPSQAEALFREMLAEAGVTVLLNRRLVAAKCAAGRLQSADFETDNGLETVAAAMFIDGTYEGDLMASAGVSYTVGREPASTYGESLGGQWQTVAWKDVYQFCHLPLSPFVEAGDPSSGLLPEIASDPVGKPGQGDFRVQSYNFRMFLTDQDGKIPFPKPEGYDVRQFALLARFLNLNAQVRWTLNYTTAPMTDGPVQMRNGDSNNAGSFSSDYVDGSHRWPDGTYEVVALDAAAPPRRGLPVPLRELYALREEIFRDHVNYQQGLMYFLANDRSVPAELRARVNRFGLDPREFPESGHWPHALYVREGRRMVSDYVMTQADCESVRVAADSVGLASYSMDSHFCQRVVVEEAGVITVRNEGAFGHGCPKPYPVSYRSIVPSQGECANLLVPGCLSASHVAYGSIRMEPVFMILGQSAGVAAALAIDLAVAVQGVPYAQLKAKLLEGNQRL